MDFSPTSAGLFRDLGGLAAMIQRLQAEVGLAGSKLDAAAAADKGKQPAGEGLQEYAVAYSRRLLLKSLLRAIALASYAPGSAARPQVCVLHALPLLLLLLLLLLRPAVYDVADLLGQTCRSAFSCSIHNRTYLAGRMRSSVPT